MSDIKQLVRNHPFAGKKVVGENISILPINDMGKIMLERSNLVPDIAIDKIAEALDMQMPTQVGRMARQAGGEAIVICLSPGKWMLLCDDNQTDQHISSIEKAISKNKLGTITLSQVTDQYELLEISRKNAKQLLEKGCSIDLHPGVFKHDHAASTLLAQADVVLWGADNGGYQLAFDTSLGNYLWLWLQGAAAEFI
jgi:sarcosine oxidase subunit gamma